MASPLKNEIVVATDLVNTLVFKFSRDCDNAHMTCSFFNDKYERSLDAGSPPPMHYLRFSSPSVHLYGGF